MDINKTIGGEALHIPSEGRLGMTAAAQLEAELRQPLDGSAPLEDVAVLHINHCMDNTFSFNDVLKSMFSHVTFVTPPYSIQDIPEEYPGPCYHGMRRDGVYHLMKNKTELGCGGTEFLEATLLLLEEAFRRELIPLLRQGKKLLIIEDGGYHFEALPRVKHLFPEVEDRIIGVVEQTTSGTRRSMSRQGYRYAYPCASIARSDIKMNVESIFIGQRIVEELGLMLYAADTFYSFQSVLLIGYGIVGRSCRMALEGRFCRIGAYDTNPRMLRVAENDGLRAYSKPDPEMFSGDTIVIGCVGAPSFGADMFRAFLEGPGTNLYLASGSSKEVEFSYFLRYLAGKEAEISGLVLEGWETAQWHACYRFRYGGTGKNVYLMAEGKPVNFYREGVVSLTYRVIDLVFTEMLKMALYLCRNRALPPQLYVLGEDNPLTRAVSEKELLDLWFQENHFWYKGELEAFLRPHPLAAELRKITWEKDYGEDY